jgi:hypothetical protein
MNIDNLTIGQAKALAAMFGGKSEGGSQGLTGMVGEKRLVRTYSAGVWFGLVAEKDGGEIILTNARRLWQWKAKAGISLSGVALSGVEESGSRIAAPVAAVWLQPIELIACSGAAVESIEGAPHAKAQ